MEGQGKRNLLCATLLLCGGVPAVASAAVLPTLSYGSVSKDFSSVNVGSAGTPRTVTLSNRGAVVIGNLSLSISGANAGDFSKSGTCGASLAAGARCTVDLTFAPAGLGSRSATLRIGGLAWNAPATIALTGNGVHLNGYTSLSAASYGAAQPATTLTFSVNRDQSAKGAVSVQYSTRDGTAKAGVDYTAMTGTVSWASGETARKTVSIPLGTTGFDGTRSFSIDLSNPAGGAWLGSVTSATASVAGRGAATPPPPVVVDQPPSTSAASLLAARLGRPARLLVGLGTGSATADILAQGLAPDFYDRYLVGVGAGDWTTWNSPSGQYINEVAKFSDQMGAVPMFTLYQMAANGDGNLAGLKNQTFMKGYWNNVRLLFQRLAIYGKPAVVNLEPDFWGYVELQSGGGNPNQTFALVNFVPECAALPNDVSGLASCLVLMAHTYAPRAVLGFPPSDWGGDTQAKVITFMNQLGAASADFIVMQTLDGDAGCYEAASGRCQRTGTYYWDESNKTHPNFTDHFSRAKAYHDGIGGLPILWWQTPLGVPSDQPGGTARHFRDNRAHYFLTHAGELVAAGGFGIVFSNGDDVTGITTDGGQFKTLSTQYLSSPALLP